MKGSLVIAGENNSSKQVVGCRLIFFTNKFYNHLQGLCVDEEGLLSIGTIKTVCFDKEVI